VSGKRERDESYGRRLYVEVTTRKHRGEEAIRASESLGGSADVGEILREGLAKGSQGGESWEGLTDEEGSSTGLRNGWGGARGAVGRSLRGGRA
jgi:hypothetical protein